MSVAGNPKHNLERESMMYPWVLCVLGFGVTPIAAAASIRRRLAQLARQLPVATATFPFL
jgi:hypothetical protein